MQHIIYNDAGEPIGSERFPDEYERQEDEYDEQYIRDGDEDDEPQECYFCDCPPDENSTPFMFRNRKYWACRDHVSQIKNL